MFTVIEVLSQQFQINYMLSLTPLYHVGDWHKSSDVQDTGQQ